MNDVILHGEVMIKTSVIPANAQPLSVEGPYLIVGESEVSGNHHVVDCPEGVQFYVSDGVRYMKNTVPTQIRCLLRNRHDEITLNPGSYQFGTQKEYDYFEQSHRQVRD